MADFRRLIDEIQSILRSLAPPDEARIVDLAGEHAALCAEINERLRQCMALLDQGLRSEAIQQCNIEPSLLDVVAALDFPELPQWLDLLARRGIYGPPALLLDAATALNQAYAKELPLAGLLGKHRWLGLARAPLAMRIEILREIARRDPQTLVWQEDLREFQRARLAEITRELPAAISAQDAAELAQVGQELGGEGWLVPPPPPLILSVRQALEGVKVHSARTRLKEIEPELNAAHANLDAVRGRELRQQWQQCISLANPAEDDEVVQLAAPALDWLAEEDQREARRQSFAKALSALRRQIAERGKPAQLQAAHRRACSFGQDLPEELEADFQECLVSRQRQQRRQRWLLAVATLVVLVGGMCAAWKGMEYRRHANDVAAASDELQRSIEAGDLQAAESCAERWRQQDPRVIESASVALLLQNLKERQQHERERVAEFEQLMGQLKSTSPLPDAAILAKAEALAKISAEVQRVQGIKAELEASKARAEAAEMERKRERDLQAQQALLELKQELDQLPLTGDDQLRQKLTALQDRARQLGSRRSQVRESTALQISALETRLSDIQNKLDQASRRESGERSITRAVGDAASFATRLREYAAALPADARAADFRGVAAEKSCWEQIQAWNTMASEWNTTDRTRLAPLAVEYWTDRIKAMQEKVPGAISGKQFPDILQNLIAIARRKSSSGSFGAIYPLKTALSKPLLSQLQMIQTDDGSRYYFRPKDAKDIKGASEVKKAAGSVYFSYIVDAGFTKRPKRLDESKASDARTAPHVELVHALLEKLTALETSLPTGVDRQLPDEAGPAAVAAASWEGAFRQIILDLFTESARKQIDPIVRATIVREVFKAAAEGSYPLKSALSSVDDQIKLLEPHLETNWMNPEDQAATKARARVEEILDRIAAKMEAAFEKAGKLRNAFYTNPVPPLRWLGWLKRDEEERWTCAMQDVGNDAGELIVVYKAGSDAELQVGVVGTAENREFKLDTTAREPYKEGRPVFLRVRALSPPGGS